MLHLACQGGRPGLSVGSGSCHAESGGAAAGGAAGGTAGERGGRAALRPAHLQARVDFQEVKLPGLVIHNEFHGAGGAAV